MHRLIMLLIALLSMCSLARADGKTPAQSGNFVCNGGHIRCSVKPEDYKYHQFGMRKILDFAGYSDLLNPGPPLEHYQTFLIELDSRRADTNAVAFWADAMARANNARVWGAFVSARSELPEGHDAQLIGMEIDVLNDGLPGVYPNQSKVGLQIVGFGRVNTNAIEVLTQSGDSGQFVNAFNVQANSVTPDGSVFGIAPQNARIGLNFEGSHFADSAVLLSSDASITFRKQGTPDVKIYRDQIGEGHFVMNVGPDGIRITNAQNSENLLNISNDGYIRSDSLLLKNYSPWLWGFALLLSVSLGLNIFSLLRIERLRKIMKSDLRLGGSLVAM